MYRPIFQANCQINQIREDKVGLSGSDFLRTTITVSNSSSFDLVFTAPENVMLPIPND